MTAYTGTQGNDTFSLVAGDTLNAGNGDDTVSVDLSTQTIAVNYNAINAATNTGNAPIAGMLIRNVEHLAELKTGSGADVLTISLAQGIFTWYAGSGNDRLVANYSADTNGFSAYLSGSSYYLSATGSAAYSVESVTVTGGSGNDDISGTAGKDVLSGGGGDDVLNGLNGISVLDGGDGYDAVSLNLSTATAAILYDAIAAQTATGITLADTSSVKNVEGLDELKTGSGDDVLTVSFAQGGFTWYASGGTDRLVVDYSAEASGFSAYVSGDSYYLSATGSTAYNIESVSITGGSGSDDIDGTNLADTMNGGGGNDVLNGRMGVSTLDGGAGTDTYSLDLSDAVIDIHLDAVAGATAAGTTLEDGSSVKNAEKLANFATGSGNDTLTLSFAQGTFTWQAGDGDDRLIADYSTSTAAIDAYVSGDSYYISSTGSTAYNVESVSIKGGFGADSIVGTTGNDALSGGGGSDILDGKTGVSTLDGGNGTDTVSLDLSDATVAIVYDAIAAATGIGISLADGSTVKSAEKLGELDTGSGNDSLTVRLSTGTFVWQANDGADVLIADYSAATTGFDAYASGDSYYLANTSSTAYNIERVRIIGGSGADDISGTTGDDDITGGGGNDTLDGKDGTDTAAYRNATAAVTVSLLLQGAGQNTGGAGTDTLHNFENLTGSAFADTLTGDNNRNVIDGGVGADAMAGGLGDDDYYVDNAGDVVTEAVGGGRDTVYSAISFNAVAQDIEVIVLTGTLNTSAFGNTLDNTLIGNSGNNTLNGGTGRDMMSGGTGNDTYYVDNPDDNVIELANAGTDLVYSNITLRLNGNIENLTLTGNQRIDGTGNDLNNVIRGNNAANRIDGAAGADTMYGGGGNDTYVVDNAGDTVSEHTDPAIDDGGIDTVISSIGYILGEDLENLTLTGTAAIAGKGNNLSNIINGNAGDNTLRGYGGNDVINGGEGTDTMYGGSGDDTYYVDNAADRTVEITTLTQDEGGKDKVMSSVSYTLGLYVENLTLTGNANINATGNSMMNVLLGNAGSNVLDGRIGADAMWGGAGNDDYYVDNAFDFVSELNSTGGDAGGVDTVHTYVDYQLADYVENIELLGTATLATGNGLANRVTGNASDNRLDGLDGNDTIRGNGGSDRLDGGLGNDIMYGGAGNDTYIVDSSGDKVSEQTVVGVDDGGIDTVLSFVSFQLGAFIENLSLDGTANATAGGNGLSNTIIGNDGNNIIVGLGGNDTLMGGAGADSFRFGPGSGADLIRDFSTAQGDTIYCHDYASAAHTVTQSGLNVIIDFGGGNTITVEHADINDAAFMASIVF